MRLAGVGGPFRHRHGEHRAGAGADHGLWRPVHLLKRRPRFRALVIGWRPGAGIRTGRIGSLLAAVRTSRVWAGSAGTGFIRVMWAKLETRLAALQRDTPAVVGVAATAGVVWVELVLVGEVVFAEPTSAGICVTRHGVGCETSTRPRSSSDRRGQRSRWAHRRAGVGTRAEVGWVFDSFTAGSGLWIVGVWGSSPDCCRQSGDEY
ncbi:ATP dependent DNA ligase, partial [Nocardia sp. NPDC004711]